MSLPVYPSLSGLTFPIKWIPRFYNMKPQTTASGADIDLGLAANPLHDFELQYDFMRSSQGQVEFQTLMGFVLQMAGNPGRFLFSNPADNSVTGQAIGTGDGTTTTFTLVRTFGAGGFSGSEPIGYVNSSSLKVYDNGVLKNPPGPGQDYSLSQTTAGAQTITFTSYTPASGHSITADFSFWYYCKFPSDAQEFDEFLNQLWTAQKVLIHSCRPGA